MSIQLPVLQRAFSHIPDFRNSQGKRYKLQTILMLTSIAILHGAQSEHAIVKWTENEGGRWMRLLGIRRRRGPSQATIHRILRGVDKSRLEAALQEWYQKIDQNIRSAEFIGEDKSEDLPLQNRSLETLTTWMGKAMDQMADQSKIEFITKVANSPFKIEEPQHISEAGLKFWGIDFEELDSRPAINYHTKTEMIGSSGNKGQLPAISNDQPVDVLARVL